MPCPLLFPFPCPLLLLFPLPLLLTELEPEPEPSLELEELVEAGEPPALEALSEAVAPAKAGLVIAA